MNGRHSNLLAEAHHLDRAGQGTEALAAYEAFLDREPRHVQAWVDYAGQLLVLHRLEEATRACERALRIDPRNLGAKTNQACIRLQEGQWEASEALLRQVLTADPHRVDARLALVRCLINRGEPGEAEQSLAKVIRKHPKNAAAHQHLGSIYYAQGRWAEFRAELDRYRRVEPDSAYGEFEQGFLDLLFGDMAQGWERHEVRWRIPGLVGPARDLPEPWWNGDPFPDRTLLLHHEQGLGDTLMFVRYAPLVKARGGRVLLEVQPSLAELVATCDGVDEVIPFGAPRPSFDLQASLLSLPWLFRTDLASIPAEIPYLSVPEEVPHQQAIAKFLALATAHGKMRIGLVWAGNPSHKRDRERSLPVAALAPLRAIQGVAWFSLQLDSQELPPLPNLVSLAPYLGSFSDTAYALSGMDLVITVDTALAHLAGAMGIPTLLLVTFSPDWRWMLERPDSPWYPTLRICRQPEVGDWGSVIRTIVQDLTQD